MKENYNLYLDDFRIPLDSFHYTFHPMYNLKEWVIVRSYDEFVKMITERGLPEIVSFDHDLSDCHYKDLNHGGEIKYDDMVEKTGYHCAKWLIDYCISNDYLELPEYYGHSMNPVGKKNIKDVLDSYTKYIEKRT